MSEINYCDRDKDENSLTNSVRDSYVIDHETLSFICHRLDTVEKKLDNRCSQLEEIQTVNILEMKQELKKIVCRVQNIAASSTQNSYLTELYNSVSLPGMRYVANRQPTLHRWLWVLIHAVTFLISCIYIQEAYAQWQSAPIVQSLTVTKTKDIPFPAITICEPLTLKEEYNQSAVLDGCSSVDDNGTVHWMCSEEDLKMLRVSLNIKQMHIVKMIHEDNFNFNDTDLHLVAYLQHILDYSVNWKGMEYIEYVNKLVKEINYRVVAVYPGYLDKKSHFLHVTSTRMTQIGEKGIFICNTFNGVSLGIKDNKVEELNRNGRYFKFKTSSFCNPENVLEKDCKENLIYSESMVFVRFELPRDVDFFVFLHSPVDYPVYQSRIIGPVEWDEVYNTDGIHNQWWFLSPKPEYQLNVHLTLTPKLISARKDLIEVDVSKRDCTFSFEKNLSLFEFYTHQNCIIDCHINCALEVCGCVPLSLVIMNSSFNICNEFTSRECVSLTLPNGTYYVRNDSTFAYPCSCDCPADCVSLSYSVEKSVENVNKIPGADRSSITLLNMKYEKSEFISTYSYSATSTEQFLAYSFGILGVFNGFSLMLVWEVLYWMTLRLWHRIKRNRPLHS